MPPPNHHADHPAFAGPRGLLAALSMVVGRGDVARLAADLTRVGPADRVVDVGCGPGAAAREAARRGAAVTAVDPAAVMLAVARRLTRRRLQVVWAAGAAEDLPQPDGSATALWSLATVHHWADVAAGLAEAHRVLGSGGRFLVVEHRVQAGAEGLAGHGWTRDQAESFAAACREVGFADVVVGEQRPGRRPELTVQAVRP
ncbi:MAG: class I SAM-dependent methyltransferase [Acidimicrobiales bacterium]